MRNNPKHGHKLEFSDLFSKYTKIEKIRRFFSMKRQKIYKHFMVQPYLGNFVKRHIGEFVKSIDDLMKMNGKLVEHFVPEKIQKFVDLKDDEILSFEVFY